VDLDVFRVEFLVALDTVTVTTVFRDRRRGGPIPHQL
jgi:hypothetical protein